MNDDRPRDLDVSRLVQVLVRAALPVIGTALVLGLLTYFYSQSRPAVYEAAVSLAALPSGGGNAVINTTLITASPLPPSVVSGALRSQEVVDRALRDFQSSVQPSAARQAFLSGIRKEQRSGDLDSLGLSTDINQDFVGVYNISVRAATPGTARAAANAFARALLVWDRERALGGVLQAKSSLQSQRSDLQRRIAGETQALEAQTLRRLLADVTLKLQQVDVLEQSAGGTLSLLASAALPARPVAPRPLRDAALVFGAALFFGTLFAFLLDQQHNRIRTLEELRSYGLPVLGTLPPLRAWGRSVPHRRTLELVRRGAYREQMEFVRVGLLSSLERSGKAPAVMLSSAEMGVGKSTASAGLALSLAGENLRVLLIDADVFRSSQPQIWPRLSPDESSSLSDDRLKLYRSVGPHIDLLVSQVGRLDPASIQQAVSEARASGDYDLILIDAPPALQIADTLVLARSLEGLILVVHPESDRALVDRLVDEAARLQVRLLGFVMNRFQSANSSYSYQLPETPYELSQGRRVP